MWLLTRKPLQPVVAAHRLLFNAFVFAISLGVGPLWADTNPYLALLQAHTPEELAGILDQAEDWANSRIDYPAQPIAIVLHGQEANAFVKRNYQAHQALVDKAAKLDAFNVVDIKICETWMGANQIPREQLPAFVDTVSFGPSEIERLLKAGSQKF